MKLDDPVVFPNGELVFGSPAGVVVVLPNKDVVFGSPAGVVLLKKDVVFGAPAGVVVLKAEAIFGSPAGVVVLPNGNAAVDEEAGVENAVEPNPDAAFGVVIASLGIDGAAFPPNTDDELAMEPLDEPAGAPKANFGGSAVEFDGAVATAGAGVFGGPNAKVTGLDGSAEGAEVVDMAAGVEAEEAGFEDTPKLNFKCAAVKEPDDAAGFEDSGAGAGAGAETAGTVGLPNGNAGAAFVAAVVDAVLCASGDGADEDPPILASNELPAADAGSAGFASTFLD